MKRRELLTAAGVAGGGAVAAASPVAAQDETETSTPTGGGTGTSTPTESGSGGGGNTWTVEMNDSNVYEPAELAVRPGDTVVWENVGSADHSVTAYEDDIPDGADYWASGGFDAEDAARDAWADEGVVAGGETYEHTFETEGVHEYFCIPHETIDMVGSVEVSTDAPTPEPSGGGGGGGGRREVNPEHMGVPFQAHFVGLATGLMVVVSLVYTFFVLKYGESPNTKGGND